jgi:hypothetical protein
MVAALAVASGIATRDVAGLSRRGRTTLTPRKWLLLTRRSRGGLGNSKITPIRTWLLKSISLVRRLIARGSMLRFRSPKSGVFSTSTCRSSNWGRKLSASRYHSPGKTRFRLLARLCRTGLVNRRVSMKGFTFEMILLSRASWRNVSSFYQGRKLGRSKFPSRYHSPVSFPRREGMGTVRVPVSCPGYGNCPGRKLSASRYHSLVYWLPLVTK